MGCDTSKVSYRLHNCRQHVRREIAQDFSFWRTLASHVVAEASKLTNFVLYTEFSSETSYSFSTKGHCSRSHLGISDHSRHTVLEWESACEVSRQMAYTVAGCTCSRRGETVFSTELNIVTSKVFDRYSSPSLICCNLCRLHPLTFLFAPVTLDFPFRMKLFFGAAVALSSLGVVVAATTCKKDACYNIVALNQAGNPNLAQRKADCSSIFQPVKNDNKAASTRTVYSAGSTITTTQTILDFTATTSVTATSLVNGKRSLVEEDGMFALAARDTIVLRGKKPSYAGACAKDTDYAIACLCYGVKQPVMPVVTQTILTTQLVTSTIITTTSVTTVSTG